MLMVWAMLVVLAMCIDFASVTFGGNSQVTFNENMADDSGGALFIVDISNVTFQQSHFMTIKPNLVVGHCTLKNSVMLHL